MAARQRSSSAATCDSAKALTASGPWWSAIQRSAAVAMPS
jgi:hypothetical protein